MPNEVHVAFLKATLSMIDNTGAAALGLTATTVEELRRKLGQEHDCVNRPLRSLYTQRLRALDTQRDGLFSLILSRLAYAWADPNADVSAAADDIQLEILEIYPRSIKEKGGQRKTGVIEGLLLDLEKIDEGVLKALGVDVIATQLKSVNSKFEQAYLARNTEQNERGTGTTEALRAECNALYRRLCLEAECIAGTPDSALAAIGDSSERERATAQRTLMRRFVEDLNRHIAYYKVHYRLGKAAAAGTPDGSAEPAGDAESDGNASSDGSADSDSSAAPSGPTDVTEVL